MSADPPIRVLIVDDDEVDRMAVKRAFRAAGLAVEATEARDVAGALEALEGGSFHCVLLDYQLPGGDGLRVLRRARAAGIRIPILMLTGQRDDETAVKLMKAGASDYLPKDSLSPERLGQAVRNALRVHQAEEQALAAERAMRESEARFRILHETTPDGFMIFRSVRDAEGRVVDFVHEYVNPASEQLLGKTAEELVGTRMLEVFPGNREEGLFEMYCEVVETGEPRQAEVHYGQDHLDLWLRITAARLGDGFAVGFSDISRRKRAEEERERALAARNRFYATMSHEIRTPINAILGYTDLLLAGAYGSLSGVQSNGIERAHRAARHLLELVNDVLDLSKLEAGKLEVQLEPTVLPHLVDDLFTTVRPLAEEGGCELRMSVEGCDRPVLTDPRRVRQILLNLLSNAIKFGRSRPVEVRCAADPAGGIRVEVVDQGIGIAPDDLPRVFEEFVQLSEGGERGTGLGLSISKRLADLLGGGLEVESEVGRGSTFRLRLPESPPGAPTGEWGIVLPEQA